MSIENQITRLQGAKESIKTAIEAKGVTVGDDVKLDGYAALIDNISVGSGDGEEHVNPDFYNVRTNNGTDYSYLFSNYSGTNLDHISNWDTSNVTNMYYMFNQCINLTSLDLSNFDTSSVTNMSSMFNYCRNLTSFDLSNFDTSSVENMDSMFKDCSGLTSLDLSNFDTSSVTNMNSMFSNCTKLISVDITGWDTAKVTNINSIFYNYSNMVLIHVYGELDLSSLTNGFYPSQYNNPVSGCKSLETLYLKNIYKNCAMTNATKWSINLGDTAVKDECLIYIINKLPDLINDKKLTSTNNIILTLPKTNTLTEEQVKIATDKGWQVTNVTYDLPYYNVSYNLGENIITPTKQKAVANKRFVLTLSTINNDYCFESVTVTMGDTTITPTYISNSDGFKTIAVIDIAEITADITITASAKEVVRYTTFVVGVEDPSVNNILCIKGDIEEVFINGELQNLPNDRKYVVEDGDIIKINNNVVNDSELRFPTSTISSTHNFELQSSVSNLREMFSSCKSLTSLDMSNFDTLTITDMNNMFFNCTSLTTLDLSNFNTSSVTNMVSMFSGCSSLSTLDLSSFDTRNVTSYSRMLSNVPATCTIYINPDTFINKSTGKTFTPADLGWTGTFSVKPPSNPSSPSEPNSPLTPQQAEYTTFTMGPTETGMLVVLNNHNNSVQELYVENTPQDLPQVSITQLLSGEISEEIEITTLMAILPVKEGDTIKIKGGFSLMANTMFENMVSISNITIQSNLEDCSYMFAGCIGLTETPVIPINAVNCDSMFTVTGITEAPVIPKNVKNCKDMFSGAAITKAPVIPEGVTDCSNMFKGCIGLTEANITIPSSTTTCENMFNGCTSLTIVPTISEGVTNTSCMFMGCTSLTTAAVIPTTVTNCGQMYSGCTNLQDITQQNVNLMPAFTGYCRGCYEECTKIVEPINYTQIPDIWREP